MRIFCPSRMIVLVRSSGSLCYTLLWDTPGIQGHVVQVSDLSLMNERSLIQVIPAVDGVKNIPLQHPIILISE